MFWNGKRKQKSTGNTHFKVASLTPAQAPARTGGFDPESIGLPPLTAEQEAVIVNKVMGEMKLAPMAGGQNNNDPCCFCVTQFVCLIFGITIDETTGMPSGVALCDIRCGQCTEGVVPCPAECSTNGACTFCVARNFCATIQFSLGLGDNGMVTSSRICRVQSCADCVPGCGPCPAEGSCACPPAG